MTEKQEWAELFDSMMNNASEALLEKLSNVSGTEKGAPQ
jgi:hypothetical protein